MTNNLAHYIDHTNLKAFATKGDIEMLCREAVEYGFAAVCVNAGMVNCASKALGESGVALCAVVGFPLGASPTCVKLTETHYCLDHGATEIDMVINIGAAKEENWSYVQDEINKLAELCHSKNATLKVIFENCYLTDDQIATACKVSVGAGADYVKTSTGCGTSGATIEDVTLMKSVVGDACRIKAAGGIRDTATAQKMIDAGADRIGASASIGIVGG